jgi:hypothetical protein
MRELKQRLSLSISGAVFTESMDAAGFPEMKVVASGETIFVKIETLDNAGRVDGLGLPQRVYSPHKCEILQDADTISSLAVRYTILGACAKLGMRLEIWEKAALPSSFDLSGATQVDVIRADEINPMTSSQ